MNPVTVFFVVVVTVAVCMILFQVYSIYLNYDNIKEFNAMHSPLEYSKMVNVTAIDRRVQDANDDIYDAKQKWRCVKFDDSYVSLSMFGYKADGVGIRRFRTLNGCIDYTFSTSTHSSILNPCIPPNDPKSRECTFLKSTL
ncbi:m116L [Myxoma virus]